MPVAAYCVSVAALCFMRDQAAALAEMFRVTRRRIVVGLLNRRSLLYLAKGRHGGERAYRGAHWHTAEEVRDLFLRMPCEGLQLAYGVFFPSGHLLARSAERVVPRNIPCGAFLAASASVSPSRDTR